MRGTGLLSLFICAKENPNPQILGETEKSEQYDSTSVAVRIISFTVCCNLQETLHYLLSRENETHAHILSDIKCFCYALERKHFI